MSKIVKCQNIVQGKERIISEINNKYTAVKTNKNETTIKLRPKRYKFTGNTQVVNLGAQGNYILNSCIMNINDS